MTPLQLAKDVCQSVFIHLARKAASLREGNALPGWLYRVTVYEAANDLRAELRRRQRETAAMNLAEFEANSSSVWASVMPFLEEEMGKLGRVDQDALVRRFFRDQSWREVGAALGLTEDATQKRVSRALESLRSHMARRGVKVASGALGAALAAHAVQAAPAGIAPLLANAALDAGATSATGILSTICQTFLMTKTTATIVAVLAVGAAFTPLLLTRGRGPDARLGEGHAGHHATISAARRRCFRLVSRGHGSGAGASSECRRRQPDCDQSTGGCRYRENLPPTVRCQRQ